MPPESLSAEEWERWQGSRCRATGTISERPQVGDIGFSTGVSSLNLGRRRLFLARNTGAARIDGFLLCNPVSRRCRMDFGTLSGPAGRVRGTIPFLMHQALQQFQREGVERASLCLVPAMRCEQPLPGDSPLIRRAMTMSRYFGFIFDVVGLIPLQEPFPPALRRSVRLRLSSGHFGRCPFVHSRLRRPAARPGQVRAPRVATGHRTPASVPRSPHRKWRVTMTGWERTGKEPVFWGCRRFSRPQWPSVSIRRVAENQHEK